MLFGINRGWDIKNVLPQTVKKNYIEKKFNSINRNYKNETTYLEGS